MKQEVILVVSERMDANKKPDRNEGALIRMPAKTRKNLNFRDNTLTVGKGEKSRNLRVFKAFSDDIKKLKSSGKYTAEDLKRVAFVTSDTFRRLTGKTKGIDNVWLSDDIESTVLGADPEFLLFNENGEIVRANSTGLLEYFGEMGYDGAMAEIRPKPSDDPAKLVDNMKKIFAKYNKVLDSYVAKAMCYHKDNVRDYPVGGHIHVGNPRQLLNIPFEKRVFLLYVLNKILDELLAVPMIKLDGKVGSDRRTKCQMAPNNGYGYFGEYRTDSGSGNNRRLENRTLSGMWLLHPSVAKAVIGCAKVIVDEVYNQVYDHKLEDDYFGYEIIRAAGREIWTPSFKEWKNIPLCKDMKCTRNSKTIINALNKSDPKMITESFMKNWMSAMKSFNAYKKYSDYVEAFHDIMLLSRQDLNKWPKEIKKNWVEDSEFIVHL